MVASLDPFDLIRAWFQAFNSGDLEALIALYHEDATADSGSDVARGRGAIRRSLASTLSHSAQRAVRMIARVETGAMHAEWRGSERSPDTGLVSTIAGYDDFTID